MAKKKEENPWKTQGTQEVYTNPWMTVKEYEVIKPSGDEGIYGVVHFHNYAMGIVPLDDQMNTWLVGQWRYALSTYSWEIPMGGGPLEQSKLESAKRELLEETGLTAEHWELLGKVHTSNSITDEEGYVYLATDLEQGPSSPEDTEVLKIRKLPLEEAVQMVMEGQITDSVSMAGLLMAARKFEI